MADKARGIVFQKTQISRFLIIALLLSVPLGAATVTAASFWIADPTDWQKFLARLWQELSEDKTDLISHLLLLVFGCGAIWVILSGERNARLQISSTQLEFHSGFTGIFSRYQPSWSADFSNILNAELRPTRKHATPQLIINLQNGGTHQLPLQGWYSPELGESRGITLNPLRGKQKNAELLLRESSLLKLLHEHGVEPQVNMQPYGDFLSGHFDLTSSTSCKITILLFTILGLYAALDGGFSYGERYAETPPYGLFVICGLVGAFITFRTLRSTEVPRLESIGLALMLGIATACAAWPATIRANAAFGESELIPVKYRLQTGAVLMPDAHEFPSLHAPTDNRFWYEQPIGSEWIIHLRKGGLDIWQYDSGPVFDMVRDYYQRKRND